MENVITLGELIGFLFLFIPPHLYFVFENSKNTEYELARPAMGTIFLVISIVYTAHRIAVTCVKIFTLFY